MARRIRSQPLAIRANGKLQISLRPVQIWVPDTRRPGFAQECLRQSQIVSQADAADKDMQHFMEAAMHDLDGWTE